MTLPQSAVSDLLDALRAGEGVDLMREFVRIVLQELIEAEARAMRGAPPVSVEISNSSSTAVLRPGPWQGVGITP